MFKSVSLKLLIAGCALALQPSGASAQDFPNRPIRLITNAGVGTPSDTFLRILGAEIQKSLGQPGVVEAKLGGGGAIAYEYVAKEAPADGYTYLLGNLSLLSLFPLTVKDLRFDPIKDFVPVVGLAELNLALSSEPKAPWKNFNEMVTYIRANPNKMFYGGSSVFTRLWTAGLMAKFGLTGTYVNYGLQADSYRDLLAGSINVLFIPLGPLMSLGDANGKPGILAVTSPERDPLVPNVPTMAELGAPELGVGGNLTLVARTGTPKAAIDKMEAAMVRAIQQPEVRAMMDKVGLPPLIRSPAEIDKKFAELNKVFSEIAVKIDLKPE